MPIDPPTPDADSSKNRRRRATDEGRFDPATSPPTEVQDQQALESSIGLSGPPRIPGYELTGKLGGGAFGVVWRAVQLHTGKQVAVKVFIRRAGLDWLILQREVERLVRLDSHPNVVTLLDAELEHDPPSYVMELITGGTLARSVNLDDRPPVDTIIRWMTEIAEALTYIHGKGLIHCDLKPANVLLDDQGHVRVSDFGQARVLVDASVALGTLFYMAPEQAYVPTHGKVVQPDVRWDIYALGATIYALLMGHAPRETPRNTERLSGTSELEFRLADYRKIVMETPIESWGKRGAKSIHREFEAIVLKCLSYDPELRYRTCQGVLNDLNALRAHLPVTPLLKHRRYRASKFLRRNRALVAGVLAVFFVLVAGIIVSTSQYLKAEAARHDTEQARMAADANRAGAERARDDAEAVVKFLSEMMSSADPGERGRDIRVRQVLDEASQTIHDKFQDKPLIEARLRHVIGTTYLGLGMFEAADEHISAAAAIYRRELGPSDQRTLACVNDLGALLEVQGKIIGAEKTHRENYEINRRILGDEHSDTLRSMSNLAQALYSQGRYVESIELQEQALETRRRMFGDEHPDTLASVNNLAMALSAQGRFAEAEARFRKVLEILRRVHGEEHPNTLKAANNLANALFKQGRYAEARELFRTLLEPQRRVLGVNHPDTLKSMNNLANVLVSQGHYEEAEVLYSERLQISRRTLGEEHPSTLSAMTNLASALRALGRFTEAEELQRHTWELRRRVLGEDHPDTLSSINNLAALLSAQGKYTEAESLDRQSLEVANRILGGQHPSTLNMMCDLASVLRYRGQFVEAEALHRSADEGVRSVLGDEHPLTLAILVELAETLRECGKEVEAGSIYSATIETGRRILGGEHPNIGAWLVGWGETLLRQGNAVEAHKVAIEGLVIQRKALPENHPRLSVSESVLGACLTALGRYAEAEPLLLSSYDRLVSVEGDAGYDARKTQARIINLYDLWEAAERGRGYDERASRWRARSSLPGPNEDVNPKP